METIMHGVIFARKPVTKKMFASNRRCAGYISKIIMKPKLINNFSCYSAEIAWSV